ncbi:universal stress protein [Halorarum salinum]|uniref:Universal stress protein n=2 Tax=Halorarum salinum TaxID=2743089 RepID=A0A7D5Q7R7_9EURY|nr:universal stress protein [Halobaculum salinum]
MSSEPIVLPDGGERARRTAEWWLVFAETPPATVHRIDVLDRLDSGVIVERDDGGGPVERDRIERPPKNGSTDRAARRHREGASTIDVLHGAPAEVILDYVAANAVDRVVTSVGDRTCRTRSFVGYTFTRAGRAAGVPVTATGRSPRVLRRVEAVERPSSFFTEDVQSG